MLAAGESRRFWPLSAKAHKSLFHLEGMSLLERTLRSLAEAGVGRFVVVQSPPSAAAVRPSDVLPGTIGPIAFVEQPEPAGQADAVLRCADLLPADFLLVQPESINAGMMAAEFAAAPDDGQVVTVAVTPRADWQLYAVVEHDGPVLTAIVEKPATAPEPAPLCNMGVYHLRSGFLDYLRAAPPDPYAMITAVGRAAADGRARITRSAADFLPLKYPGHLWGHVRSLHAGEIPGDARRGRVIGSETAVLGPRCRLDNAILGAGAIVGADCRTAPVEHWDDLDAVVVGPGASIGSRVTLGRGVRLGADSVVRDGATVDADVPDGAVVG
ncbi:MAG: UDP-N-acetylglucosamine diphosphorylase / glucose-phosphate thymidylyltransferase [Pseudonocardiales bacterium]|nr:UDP-N-acetylglucosamine diphosphorylase / glucose-phosphate thymidylyltransferase [Pseudonocardiales bacterium]MDT4942223.1 UDP-N-acetylglucosamine diphosphorylase / glucose-phosphate thymidylyltransferase [Pseudonocardiales bacterium]